MQWGRTMALVQKDAQGIQIIEPDCKSTLQSPDNFSSIHLATLNFRQRVPPSIQQG
eukprot:Gb_41564 [translate_table: standard]